LFLCVHSTTHASKPTLEQYIGSVLRRLLIEPKRKKKISLNLAPEPKRHVPRFHLNASTLRGLSKLIIQISFKKVNSRKLLGGWGGKTPTKKGKKKPNFLYFYVFYKKRVAVSKSYVNCILTFIKLSYTTQQPSALTYKPHLSGDPTSVDFPFFIPEHYGGLPCLSLPKLRSCEPGCPLLPPLFHHHATTAARSSSLA